METVETNSDVSAISKPTKKKKVGFYMLGNVLCETPTCQVREGLHTIANAKVMVKVYKKSIVEADEELRERLRRKSLVSQKLNHPNIVQLYEILETGRNYYVIEEMCEGGHLLHYLQSRERLEELEARRYMRQLVSALDHIHKTGFLHRDLRLDNIVFDRKGNIKISEVWSCTERDKESNFPCCLFYSAPEILHNRPQTEAADIWSLGVILYAMLSKSLPFLPETTDCKGEMKAKVLKDYHISDSLSPAARHLISRLIEPKEEKRIKMEELVYNPWIMLGYQETIQRIPPMEKTRFVKPRADIIRYIETHTKFDKDYIKSSVIENKKNSAAASYSLILQSRIVDSFTDPQDVYDKNATHVEETKSDPIQTLHGSVEPTKSPRNSDTTKCYKNAKTKSNDLVNIDDLRLLELDKRLRCSFDESRTRFPLIKNSKHNPQRKKGKCLNEFKSSKIIGMDKDETKLSLPNLSVLCLPIQKSLVLASVNTSQNVEAGIPTVPPNTALHPTRSFSNNSKGELMMSELCDKHCDRYSVTLPASDSVNGVMRTDRYIKGDSFVQPLFLKQRSHQRATTNQEKSSAEERKEQTSENYIIFPKKQKEKKVPKDKHSRNVDDRDVDKIGLDGCTSENKDSLSQIIRVNITVRPVT